MDQNSTNPTSRRDFLKSGTAVAVGATVWGSLGLNSGLYAYADDTIKVGLVGCGGRGSGAAKQALSTSGNVKLVAMGDAFADQLDRAHRGIKSSLGDQADRVAVDDDHKFVGFDAYQKVLESGVDLVILATPPGFRPIHFAAAVDAGKNIFCEKPVAVDAPGVRQFLQANEKAKEKGLKVGVGLQRHHENTYLETIRRIKDGAIGDMIALRCYWNGAGVWEPRKSHDEVKSEMEYQMRNWYYYTWLCGDHYVEQHIHNLDVCNWVMDDHPVRCIGMGGREVRTAPKYGQIYDHFACEFEYQNGTRMFSQARHIPNCWNSVTEHAHGTKGYADISGERIESAGEKWRYREKKNDPYQTEHDDLFAAIRENKPYNEGDYGATSTMTAILGRMATYSGKEITWDEALKSEKSLMPEKFAFDADPPVKPDEHGRYPVPVPGVTKVL